MTKLFTYTLLAVSALALSACSWIQPLPGAFSVALLPANEVTNCKKLGSTHASVASKVGFYQRDFDAVKKDLISIARNEAVNMRGDTIVATSPLENGKMDFAIYRCVK